MITQSSFKPAWWLRNRHLQTIWPSLFRRRPNIPLKRERIELPDGDFVDLDWAPASNGPLVILFHGLEGNDSSHYVRGLLNSLYLNGFQAAVMYFRGCSGEVNRLPRAYHSGDTGDINFICRHLHQLNQNRPIYAIGISLGGNALLKWLGETGMDNPLQKAVAISVPFDLSDASHQLKRTESRIYQQHLLSKMLRSLQNRLRKMDLPIDKTSALSSQTVWDYDDRVTAPLHGFSGAEDYYIKSSSTSFIKNIQVPSLIIHSKDDPFMTHAAIPSDDEIPGVVTLELSEHGGHVGFISGSLPLRPVYWIDHRVCEFLSDGLTA